MLHVLTEFVSRFQFDGGDGELDVVSCWKTFNYVYHCNCV